MAGSVANLLPEQEPPGEGPPDAVLALRRADALARWALALAAWFLAAAAPGGDGALLGLVRLALAGGALLVAAGISPRGSTLAVLILGWVVAEPGGGPPAWAAVLALGAAGARWMLGSGEVGAWLGEVRWLEARRGAALAATQLARGRARRARHEGERARALEEAGDVYERAGELRRELRSRGAESARATEVGWVVGGALSRGMGPFPGPARAVERWLCSRAGSPQRPSVPAD